MRTADAAATPLPSPFAENKDGDTACTCACAVSPDGVPLFRMFTVTIPGAVPVGTT